MQSSGTSTPAGDSPGPGRAFLRTTDFTPEIVPPRLRRTTYPAGQSPLVLPGLTRASSSFTITSNHQNILPLWPAAPPPGQPVVFFCPLSGVRPACFPSARRHGLSKVGRGGTAPYRGPCGPLCRTRDRGEVFSPSKSRSSMARQLSGLSGHGTPAIREEWPSCAALCDAPAVRQALAGPVSPPRSVRTLPALGQDARAARPSQMARRTSARGNSPFLSSSLPHPSFLSWRRRALSACCAAGERQGSYGRIARGNPAAQKKTPTGMETGGRLESFYGCGARDQNSL